jgi:ribose transport system ATP-binding protein
MTLAALDHTEFSSRAWLKPSRERRFTTALARKVELSPMAPERAVQGFSGGNQQKVMLARSLTRSAKLYAFDEPTVGVDVGTRAAIYRFIASLCEAGAGIILISSDLPEILHLAHRAYVFYGGEIKAEISGSDLTEEKILPHFFERTIA